MSRFKEMKEAYKDMEEVYQKIERELLEMGARKVAEKTGKPRDMNIVIGTEYQQN